MKKKLWAILICLMCLSFVGCEASDIKSGDDSKTESKKKDKKKSSSYKKVKINGETYYQKTGKFDGEYYYDTFSSEWAENFDSSYYDTSFVAIDDDIDKVIDMNSQEYIKLRRGVIYDYDEYEEFCENFYVDQEYDDEDSNYIVVMYISTYSWADFVPVAIEYNDRKDEIDYYYYENTEGVMASGNGYVCVIPTEADTDADINMIYCYTKEEIKNLEEYGTAYDPNDISDDKPVIYLYPEEDNTAVDVSLEFTDTELTCTYPAYGDGWTVVADSDGLIKADGKEYNYLYWEAKTNKPYVIDQGYCVKGSDTAVFLEEKLAELGLNRREANEFIVYWLPLMESNEYNVISFDTREYEARCKLHVNPAPDTMIRVFMTWYGTDEAVDIEPQIIETPERKGFTVVEWGGSQIEE